MTENTSWVPDTAAIDEPAVTVDDYVRGYLADPDAWWWTTSLSSEPAELVLPRVLAIIDAADATIHRKALGQLGAGPLEEMMSEQLLDVLESLQPLGPAMRLALLSVRIEAEPLPVRKRFEALTSGSVGHPEESA